MHVMIQEGKQLLGRNKQKHYFCTHLCECQYGRLQGLGWRGWGWGVVPQTSKSNQPPILGIHMDSDRLGKEETQAMAGCQRVFPRRLDHPSGSPAAPPQPFEHYRLTPDYGIKRFTASWACILPYILHRKANIFISIRLYTEPVSMLYCTPPHLSLRLDCS